MPDYDDKHKDFSRRLEERARKRRQPEVGTALPPEVQDSLLAWQQRLDQRLAEYRAEAGLSPGLPSPMLLPQPAPLSQPTLLSQPAPLPAHPPGILGNWLAELEAMFHDELGLAGCPVPGGMAGPPRLLADEAALRQAASQAGLTLPAGDAPPVLHLPGVGTLLNQAAFPARDGDRLGRALFMRAVARERWGWGFLLEYTALGRQAVAAGLYPALAARRLDYQFTDPAAAARAGALSKAWALLAAGWQDWVEQFVLYQARQAAGIGLKEGLPFRPRPDRLLGLVVKAINLFPLYFFVDGVRVRLLALVDLVRYLFLEENDALTESVHLIIRQIDAACRLSDPKLQALSGFRLSELFSMFYFAQLESRVGIRAVPYAVLIAAHLPAIDLRQEAARISQAFESAPRQHPDTRLALLSGLDSRVKYDPASMYTAAWERLRLDGPEEYFG